MIKSSRVRWRSTQRARSRIRVRSLHGFGAYAVSAAVAPLTFSMRFVPSVYDVQAYHAVNFGIFTNTSPTGPYRGAGRPEATYLIERLMDRAAAELGLDPVEIRRRNLITPEAMPYSTQTGFVYDSGEFERLLDQCLELADWGGFAARRANSERKQLLRGRSVAFFIEQGGIFNDQMGLRFDPSGAVTILAGTHSHGQSHATVFTQLVAEWLGVPFESVRFLQGDTDKVHFGRGTYAARSSMIGGCALRLAADLIIKGTAAGCTPSKGGALASEVRKRQVQRGAVGPIHQHDRGRSRVVSERWPAAGHRHRPRIDGLLVCLAAKFPEWLSRLRA